MSEETSSRKNSTVSQSSSKWLDVNTLTLIFLCFVLPVGLLGGGIRVKIAGLPIPGQSALSVWLPIGAGILGVLMGFRKVWKDSDRGRWHPIATTLRFFTLQGQAALLMGSGTAAILLGLYFYFPGGTPENPADRFVNAVNLYASILTLFVVVRLFYDRVAPITNVSHLLRSVSHDLESCCTGGTSLWVVYPQLNIGHYRGLAHGSLDTYNKFHSALLVALHNAGKNAHVVTIPIGEYRPYYDAYLSVRLSKVGAGSKPDPARQERYDFCLSQLTTTSEILFRYSEMVANTYSIANGYFPPHVIVIGDITYQIASYGLPISLPDGTYKSPSDEDVPAYLVAYRRQDPDLARSITSHMVSFLSDIEVAQRIADGAVQVPTVFPARDEKIGEVTLQEVNENGRAPDESLPLEPDSTVTGDSSSTIGGTNE